MRKIVILGAGGRDFHNFNTVYRDDPDVRVVAFTATQIPGIEDRSFPAELAGPRYPNGIQIVPEDELERLIKEQEIDEVVFAYSDVNYDHMGHLLAWAIEAGISVDQALAMPFYHPVVEEALRTALNRLRKSL